MLLRAFSQVNNLCPGWRRFDSSPGPRFQGIFSFVDGLLGFAIIYASQQSFPSCLAGPALLPSRRSVPQRLDRA